MLLVASAAAALLAVPGLHRCVAMATGRRADARLMAAVAFALALLIVWRASSPLHAAALVLVSAVGIVAGWIDAQRRRLPDALILPAYPAAAALLLATGDADTVLRSAACASAAAALLLIGHLSGQVGFGDVKLAGLLGLVLGWASWHTAVLALVAAAAVGAAQGMVVLALGRKDFPYGPALLIGSAIALTLPAEMWVLVMKRHTGEKYR